VEVGDEDHTPEHQSHSPLTGGEHAYATFRQPQKPVSQPSFVASLGVVAQGRPLGVASPPPIVATWHCFVMSKLQPQPRLPLQDLARRLEGVDEELCVEVPYHWTHRKNQ